MLATLNSYELYRIDEEIQHSKSELIDCRKECESTEMEMITVNQLEDKGIFILKDMERKYKELDDELEKVHHDYIKCANNVNRYEEAVSQKVSSLTQERDNLRKELSDLRKVADENSKKLIEIKKMITIQEVRTYFKIDIIPTHLITLFQILFSEEEHRVDTKIEKTGGKEKHNARFEGKSKCSSVRP